MCTRSRTLISLVTDCCWSRLQACQTTNHICWNRELLAYLGFLPATTSPLWKAQLRSETLIPLSTFNEDESVKLLRNNASSYCCGIVNVTVVEVIVIQTSTSFGNIIYVLFQTIRKKYTRCVAKKYSATRQEKTVMPCWDNLLYSGLWFNSVSCISSLQNCRSVYVMIWYYFSCSVLVIVITESEYCLLSVF